MDIYVDIRVFLEIHAWICYGFSSQGKSSAVVLSKKNVIQLINQPVSITEAYRKFSSYMLET